jgi:pilus assembly protein CpaF
MRTDESTELLVHYGAPIRDFLADPTITEICINGHDQIFVEIEGRLILTEARFQDEATLVNYVRMIAHSIGQEVSATQPMLDARLADNTRISATLPPVSLYGTSVSIRPFPKEVFRLEDLVARGAIPEDAVPLIELAVHERLNILITGGTGSGKTTVLRCVCQMVPHEDRILTAEDTAENLAPGHPHICAFEAPRRKTSESTPRITMADLIVEMLRKRPDRPVVGEIRTPEAAAALIDAINTGHGGTLSTMHANNGADAFDRMDILYARQAPNIAIDTIKSLTRKNIDLVVHVAKDRDPDGRVVRRLKEIVWVDGEQPRHLIRHSRRTGYRYDQEVIEAYKTAVLD